MLGRSGLLTFKYFLTPYLPVSINVVASMLPVSFLLLYQYCTNTHKNFFLYSLLLSAIFSFIVGPIEGQLHFVDIRSPLNLFYFFVIDVGVAFVAYWLTKLIMKMGREVKVKPL